MYDRACLDVMISTGLADYLGRAPDRAKGVHVDELQKALDIENKKLKALLKTVSKKCDKVEEAYQ